MIIFKNSCFFRYAIFDTPGQIEVFTWSASGTIITETLVGDSRVETVPVIETFETSLASTLYDVVVSNDSRLPTVETFETSSGLETFETDYRNFLL